MPKPANTGPQWVGPDLAIKPGMHPLVAKAILYRLGFETLGTGACATAFKLGQSDRVVKLVCDQAGHRGAVEMFRAHPEVEAFPAIFAYAELTNDCFIYETELLDWRGGYGATAQFDPDEYDAEDLEDFIEDFADSYGRDAARLMVKWAVDNDFYLDLHSENTMDREGGEPVIIDPFHHFWTVCGEGRTIVRSGNTPGVAKWAPDYWANVASTVPFRGASTTALVPLVQA